MNSTTFEGHEIKRAINDIPYSIIESSRRKTVSIQVRGGNVVVRAPQGICSQFVNQFLAAKYNWLQTKLKEQAHALEQKIEFIDGAFIPHLGESVELKIDLMAKSQVFLTDNLLTIGLSTRVFLEQSDLVNGHEKVKQRYYAWLKTEALAYIEPKVWQFAQLMSVNVNHIVFKRYKARWGSCNNRGELSFNSLLMMCPPWVIDYVVIHELSHLTHLNHSPQFWQRVSEYYPNYRKAQQWLKLHSYYIR